jgi:hypothetical protein
MGKPEEDRYWIVARDEARLLMAMMRALAGSAHVSFEGDLSRCEFPLELGPQANETPTLKRQTLIPQLDFAVLPLEAQSVQSILDVVLPNRRFMNDIIHIQIEKNGRLEFASYDNFHPECIVGFLGVSTDFLNTLREKGVIRSWTTPHEGARRWHG